MQSIAVMNSQTCLDLEFQWTHLICIKDCPKLHFSGLGGKRLALGRGAFGAAFKGWKLERLQRFSPPVD